SNGRCRRRLRDHDRCHPRRGEHTGGLSNKAVAEKARVAAHQHTMRLRLSGDIGSDACNSEANVGHGELVGNDCPPTGSAKLNSFAHRSSPRTGFASRKEHTATPEPSRQVAVGLNSLPPSVSALHWSWM